MPTDVFRAVDAVLVLSVEDKSIPDGAFAFLFLDPKGWRIDIAALAELLERFRFNLVHILRR